ncbi:helix-turn-helix domain-containing protein [Flavobacterium sp.]|uniref:helix-turn-helix domain-containing protein n=1 Tax=Flavobacterium sp. TaxID=239 RepID=UPI0026099D69|nr:helix-turn-helix transcriptional regulator [Flavobacterium sp.]
MQDKKINQYISHQLVKAREELNLTQKNVQEKGIIKQSNLSKIENGVQNISASKLFILANFYKKPISFFFHNENQ